MLRQSVYHLAIASGETRGWSDDTLTRLMSPRFAVVSNFVNLFRR